jgi:hypothetical protein
VARCAAGGQRDERAPDCGVHGASGRGALLLRTYSHLMPAEPDRVRRAVQAALAADDTPLMVASDTGSI